MNKTILLVDDNSSDVLLTTRALKKSNIVNEIVVAKDGVEALDYLFGTGKYAGRDIQQMPVVVLLDIRMPKMNGHEVLERIRNNPATKFMPVVMLTGSKDEIDIAKSYKNGCNAYVAKPVDFEQFTDAAKQLGLFWLVLNQAPSATTKK